MLSELWLSQRYFKTGKKEKIISLTAFISMIGIAIGVLVLIVVIAVMSGFDKFLQDKMVGTNADLTVEFYNGRSDPYSIIEELKGFPHIVAGSPFIGGQAFMRMGRQVFGIELRGIDPVLQPLTSKVREYMKEGSLDLQGNDLIMGQELASRLGLRLGDKIGLISPVTLTKQEFKIKGIFNSGMYLYDSGLVMTSLKGAQDFYKMDDSVSGIGIKVDDIYQAENVKGEIYKGLSGDFEVRTWIDANQNFLQALKLEKVVMFIVVTMTTVVAAFGIASTLIMSVMTRVKDIGILRSIGAKTGSIIEIFLFQGLSIGLSGIILGLIGGVWLAHSLNNVVDFISRLIGRSLIPKDIYYFDRIPTNINFSDVSTILFSALAITLLASIYPAYYAARINPSEAVRHE